MRRYPHVALIIETSKHYGRELIRGIGRYLSAHEPWSVYLSEREETDEEPDWLREWNGDGIITRSENPTISHRAWKRGIPAVNLGYWHNLPEALRMPCVNCDHTQTGGIVADHFLRRGFRNFAYCHLEGPQWSVTRRDAFAARLAGEGIVPTVFTVGEHFGDPMAEEWEPVQERLCAWIESLPKPTGVMAAYDVLGARILDACRRVKVRVPEEVAVVGVDNDALFCSLTSPPMSSVDQNVEQIGFRAAALLDRLMRGETFPGDPWPILLSPLGIVTRTSSDILAFNDAQVARALEFIREHAGRSIGVEEVSVHANLSRRELERRFQRVLSVSPYKEIQRARVKRVINMLLNTDYTLEVISETLEFSEAANMSALFKKITGASPGDYRRNHQLRA